MTSTEEITARFARLQEIEILAQQWIARLNEVSPMHGDVQYARYELVPNPKARYSRVTMNTGGQHGGSVHAFVELATGKVFKAAGWKAPVKRAAYDLTHPESFAALINDADWSGRYLYHRQQSFTLPADV